MSACPQLSPASLPAQPADPEAVRAFEDALLAHPQVQIETQHVIHGGMCARTIRIPAGVALTGALLGVDNICIAHGDITVTTDRGPVRLTGYHVIGAAAGRKRAGVAHADTYWTTVWRTALTDLQAIEDELTVEADRLQTRQALAAQTKEPLECPQ